MNGQEINSNDKISYSLPEASRLTGLSLPYLYKLSASGKLPVSKIGARTVILRSELEDFLRAKIRGNTSNTRRGVL